MRDPGSAGPLGGWSSDALSGGQTTAAHASSPRAREDDSTTGTDPSTASPHRPASSPLTMPRSTAHSTGYCDAASPKGQLSATTAVLPPWSSACAANPCAVSVSAMACMAVRSDRCPSPGDIWPARERPYSSPTRSAMLSATVGPSSWSASCSSSTKRSSRRVNRSSVGSLPTALNRLEGRPAPVPAARSIDTSTYPPVARRSRWWRATFG